MTELRVGDLVECDDDDYPIKDLRGKLQFRSGYKTGPFRIVEIDSSGVVIKCRLEGDGFPGCKWNLSSFRRARTDVTPKHPIDELRELLQGMVVCGNTLAMIYGVDDGVEYREKIKKLTALLTDIRDGKVSS
jgi:hypothetical protein